MKISRFSHGGKTGLCRRLTFSLGCGALLALAPQAGAQNNARPDTPPVAALPAAPNIGILLLAFDDLAAPTALVLPDPQTPPAAVPDAPPREAPPGAITPARALGAQKGAFWLAQAQIAPPDALLPAMPLPANGPQFTPALPPGRAQLAAVPLRRTLLSLGWRDVLPTAPDLPSITRLIGERRLTPRTLDALKLTLSQLAERDNAAKPELMRRAGALASRVGQTLGYRAVVALYVAPTAPEGAKAAYSLILADSEREMAWHLLFDAQGADDTARRAMGAATAANFLDKTLREWPATGPADRSTLVTRHLEAARAAVAAGNSPEAQDELNHAIALDPLRGESYVLLGDLRVGSDAAGAALAYRRAVELNARDGETWSKIAITTATNATNAAATGAVPDWPRAVESGRKAIEAGYDSVPLRVALATAQYGRADLFRKADRLDRADDAEVEARKHLDRALELAPDDPSAVRLLARGLVASRRLAEAVQILDRIAPRYPKDAEIQGQYATALATQIGREEDAFVAHARYWKLMGRKSVTVDGLTYRTLAQGFDARVDNLGKNARQITTAVANAALPREDALLQLTKLKDDMADAQNAIAVLRAPASIAPEGAAARVFAADLMSQALEQQQIYLETGQDTARMRGYELNRQAITRLNVARGIR